MSSQDMRMTPEPICECLSSSYDGGLNPLCFRQGARPLVPPSADAKMRSHGNPLPWSRLSAGIKSRSASSTVESPPGRSSVGLRCVLLVPVASMVLDSSHIPVLCCLKC
jgi:hypothetical protein